MILFKSWKNVALLFLLPLFVTCGRKEVFIYDEGAVWNTFYHIRYSSDVNLHDSIANVFETINNSVSVFNPESVVSRVNANRQSQVDDTFIKIYKKSLEINDVTNGYFDPTLSPLINLYGFGFKQSRVVDAQTVDSVMKLIGINNTKLVGSVLTKQNPNTEFNFSAIAKGLACDMIAEMFRRNGVNNFMIEIGGEICLSGHNQDGVNWNIAVDKPDYKETTVAEAIKVISLTNCGIATSGNYRNYKDTPRGRISHIINPKTGKPASEDIISATIITNDCMTADAIATACMAMPFSEAKAMVDKNKIAAMFVLPDFNVWESKSFIEKTRNR